MKLKDSYHGRIFSRKTKKFIRGINMKTAKGHTGIPKHLLYPLALHCNNSISEEIIRKEQHQHQKEQT